MAAAYDYDEAFPVEDYLHFMDEYDLWDDVDEAPDEDGERMVVLTPAAQREVEHAYDTFMDGNWDAKIEDVADAMADEVLREIEHLCGDEAANAISVRAEVDDRLSYVAITFELSIDDYTERLEPAGCYYDEDREMGVLYDAMESWNWAAWLGDDDSPFGDDEWVRAYMRSQTASWFENAANFEDADIEGACENLMDEAGLNENDNDW